MPVYEHSNIDFGKTQTHFSAIQAILRSKIIRISKIGAPAAVPYQAQAAQALPQHPMRRAQAAHRPTAQLLRNTLPRVM